MKYVEATRLLTIQGDTNPVSYWQHGEEVYRLNEYEPVQFDIYGLPLGARWETNMFNWPYLRGLIVDRYEPVHAPQFTDVSTITEYGLTQKENDRSDISH